MVVELENDDKKEAEMVLKNLGTNVRSGEFHLSGLHAYDHA